MARKNIHVDLGYTPRAWQRECHERIERFTVLVVHRQAGKSEFAIRHLINAAINFQGDLGNFIYLAPLLKQASNVVWRRLKLILKPLIVVGGADVSESDLEITFRSNGARIRLFGANNPDEIRGMVVDGVVVDEIAQITPEVWDDIVSPTLISREGWALFIGTVKGMDLLSELYHSVPRKEGWGAALYTAYQTDAINPKEVERLRREMPSRSFAREMLCDFNAGSDDQLISLFDVEQATKRDYSSTDFSAQPRILGVDPARFGDDRSVIFRRQGLVSFPPIVLHGVDNMDLASRVANEIESWSPDATFIDSGAGAGVIDRLRQLGYEPIEVPFGGRAIKNEQFNNRRTEMWWEMKLWLESGGKIPDDMKLKQELATPTYRFDSAGKKVLESKDDIKKRLKDSGSPDLADALCLTFASPVIAQHREPNGRDAILLDRHWKPEPYDPMAAFEREYQRENDARR